MRFPSRCVLAVTALLAGSLLLAACGGGEEQLDLDQYFRRFEDTKQAGDTRISMLKEESQGVGEDMEATRDYFDGFEAVFRQTLNDLDGIHPPAQAQDAHEEFVAALSEMLVLAERFNDRLADLESPSELEALLAQNEPSLDAAAERFDNACVQLQGIAHENGIEVNLGCE